MSEELASFLKDRILGFDRKPASQFLFNPSNWRKHPQPQRDAVRASLGELGWIDVVIENRQTGHLLDGHERIWNALQIDEDEPVPYIQVDLTPEEEKLALWVIDGTAAMAETDKEALDALLCDINTGEEALQAALAEAAEAVGLYFGDEPEEADAEPQVNRAEELREQWGVETGQLWRLPSRVDGQEHRLICGDCTDAAVVERVMGGERVALLFTSPPYAQQREYTKESNLTDWDSLMCGAFSHEFLSNAQVLVNLGMVHDGGEWLPYWDAWVTWMRDQSWRRFGLYIWDQGPGLPGDWSGRLAPAFEFVFHFNKKTRRANKWVEAKLAGQIASKRTFRHDDGRLKPFTQNGVPVRNTKIPDAVIRINRQIGDAGHPAPFSEAFSASIVRTWTDEGEIVYEPFSGSGTTIIAAENLARQCRAVEISPAYVAVALQRYLDAFGIMPELIDRVDT